jgi:hypothetical protein
VNGKMPRRRPVTSDSQFGAMTLQFVFELQDIASHDVVVNKNERKKITGNKLMTTRKNNFVLDVN